MSSNLISQAVATQSSWVRLQENIKRKWGLYGVDSGMHDINMAIGGFVPRKITTIAALPSHGKTALITPIIEASNHYVDIKPEFCVFSWEMEASELVDREVSYKTGLSSRDLMMGAKLLNEDSLNKIKKALEEAKKMPVSYHQESLDIDSLLKVYDSFIEDCIKKEEEDGIKRQPIAILDYVGLASFDGSGIRTYGINEFYSKLKQSANKTGGHWIILCQLDKSARNKDIPDLNDLADSQSIERNSDNIILLHRPEHLNKHTMLDPRDGYNEISSKNKVLIRIAKCRLFGTQDFIMSCKISNYKFWSMKHDENYHYWLDYNKERFWRNHFGLEEEKDFEIF